jgi:hypothetical protein
MNEEYKIKELEEELEKIKQENSILKEKLKNYTAPPRSKTYYENHKDEIINKNKEYKKKTNYVYEVSPEKKKEYAKTAYLNKKEKLQKIKENI